MNIKFTPTSAKKAIFLPKMEIYPDIFPRGSSNTEWKIKENLCVSDILAF